MVPQSGALQTNIARENNGWSPYGLPTNYTPSYVKETVLAEIQEGGELDFKIFFKN